MSLLLLLRASAPPGVVERWSSFVGYSVAVTDAVFAAAADMDADFNYVVKYTDTAVVLIQMVGSTVPTIDWQGQPHTEVQPLTVTGGMVWGVYTMTGLGGAQDIPLTFDSPMVVSVLMHGYATGGVGNASAAYARPGVQATTVLPGFTGQHPDSFVVDVWAERNAAASATTLTPSVGTVRQILATNGANTGHPAISLHTPGATTVPTVTGTYNQTSADGAGLQLEMLPVGVRPPAAGAAALTATSTLSADGTAVTPLAPVAGAANLTATGTLTATAVRAPVGAATLAATSTLTTAGTPTRPGAASLTATATLTSAAVAARVATATLAGTSTLTTAGVPTRPAAATLTAASSLTTAGVPTRPGTAALTATSLLTTDGAREQPAAATLTATSTLTVGATREQVTAATLAATSTLTTDGAREQATAGNLVAQSTLTADGDVGIGGGAALIAVATLTTAGAEVLYATAPLTATATLTTAGTRAQPATVALTAASTLTTAGTWVSVATAALTATSLLTTDGARGTTATVAMVASSTLSASGRIPGALLFADDFTGPAGTGPSSAYWTAATGAGGWGNAELEYYTATGNAALDGAGNLAITARQETVGGAAYTSARIHGNGKVATTYGRIEARIRVPKGQGLWPAFWMMADERVYGTWPRNGEIDIMEIVNQAVASFHSLHGPTTADPSVAWHLSRTWTSGADLSAAFHVYAVEWEPDRLSFYVDTTLVRTFTTGDMPAGSTWPFNGRPFYPILNLAVGGGATGAVPDPAVFPATMLVDYVRIYEQAPYTQTNPKVETLVTGFTDQREFDNWGPNVVLVNGQAQMTLTAAYPSLVSQRRFDLTNSAVSVRLVQPPNVGTGTTQAVMQLTASTGNRIEFGWGNNALYFQEIVGGVTDATYLGYSATGHQYLRVAHDGTNVVWSTSPDGATWTARRTKVSTLPLTGLGVNLVAGYYGAETAPGTVVWDDLNTGRVPGAATLAAVSTLSGDGVPIRAAAATLVAASTLTTAGTGAQPVAAALTAASTLTTTGTPAQVAAAALTATSSLAVAGTRVQPATAALTAASTLTAAGTPTRTAAAALTGTSTLTTAGTRVGATTATLQATATLTTAGTVTRAGSAALTATSTLTVLLTGQQAATAVLTATATLTGTGLPGRTVAAALTATGILTAGAIRAQLPVVALTATASLSSAGARGQVTAATLIATSTLLTTGARAQPATVDLYATGVLSTAGTFGAPAAAALTATGTLTTDGVREALAVAVLQAVATLTATGLLARPGAVSLQATGTLLVSVAMHAFGAANLTAEAKLTAGVDVRRPALVFSGWGIPL